MDDRLKNAGDRKAGIMEIVGWKSFKEQGITKNGYHWFVKLILPEISDEKWREASSFYREIGRTAVKTAEKKECTILADSHLTYLRDGRLSLYIDFLFYNDKQLLDYRRIADNRDAEGHICRPPKQIRRYIRKQCGFYETDDQWIVFENRFEPGDEAGMRRSAYRSLISERRFPKHEVS